MGQWGINTLRQGFMVEAQLYPAPHAARRVRGLALILLPRNILTRLKSASLALGRPWRDVLVEALSGCGRPRRGACSGARVIVEIPDWLYGGLEAEASRLGLTPSAYACHCLRSRLHRLADTELLRRVWEAYGGVSYWRWVREYVLPMLDLVAESFNA